MSINNLLKAIFFDDEAFAKTEGGFLKGFSFFLLVCLIFVIPTEFNANWSVMLQNLVENFVKVFILFFVVISIIFVLCKIFGSYINFENFFSRLNFILAVSLLVVSVPAFIFTKFISGIFNNQIISLALFSFIPYYTYVLFGWLCEENSGLKGWRGVVLALFSITLMFIFHYCLQFITV
jgi:hypothetical protein